MAPDLIKVTELVDAYAVLRARLAAAAGAAAARQARDFTGWYQPAAVSAVAAKVIGQVEPAQRQTAAVTDAYLLQVLAALTGRRARPTGLVDVRVLRRGVEHDAVYGRLADQYRYEVSTGTEPAAALEHVVNRAELMARTDTDLAFRAQADAFFAANQVQRYRRVVRPELSAGGTCGLCIAAADRIYSTGDLLPMHGRCKCAVLPIVGDVDPGLDLNSNDLAALYRQAGSTNRRDLVKVRYTVVAHSELGPQLRVQGQHFRGPTELAAAA